ncbi:thiol-disulfide oxidoreductase DCC family protein [Paenibacillus sp. GCM10023252]|uniref:thiol-disulfide oxidoreductase DCC family protein n=1 Tax=Paenibacillus sp. GCM10023252 TaxID=3252649 RepID=UPI003606FDC3
MKRRESLYVIYDGNCNLCLATVARLRELHSAADIHYVPIQELEAAGTVIPRRVFAIPESQLYEKLHVFDEEERIYAGADGVIRLLRTMKGWQWASSAYQVPGIRTAADAVYRYIARRRYKWFGRAEHSCEDGVCQLPPSSPKED